MECVGKMAKVLFVQKKLHEKLSIHALAAFLKQNNHVCDALIYDAESNFYDKVKSYNPDIVAYSLCIGEYNDAKTILKKIKSRSPSQRILVGGPFLTIFPEIINEDFIDMISVGDGEYPLVEILDRIEEENFNFSNIDGIYFKENNKIFGNKSISLITSLTVLPIPDRDIYYSKYEKLRNLKTKPFILSRGCPYNCSYCYSGQFNDYYKKCGKYWRLRDPTQVIDEIRYVRDTYGLKWIQFHDGTFNANKHFIKEFLKLYAESGLPGFVINSRTENVDEEYVQLLKKAGCDRVTIGVQHGNEDLRRIIANRPMKNREIIDSCNLLKKYNIRVGIDLIFGWPGETLEQAFETIDFARKLDCDSINSNVLRFYPKTAITNYAIRKGYLNQEVSIDEAESLLPNTSQLNITELINLDKLCHLAIRFPKLQWLIKLLIKLPPNKLFLIIKDIPSIRRHFKYEIKSYKEKCAFLRSYLKGVIKA